MTESPFPSPTATHYDRHGLMGRLRRRIVTSIAGVVGWVSFTLLYVAFWAHGFSLFQSIVVVVVSFLIVSAIVVGGWISFGMRFADRWRD
jgi:hypothetical protein